jgi:hypothetical protein
MVGRCVSADAIAAPLSTLSEGRDLQNLTEVDTLEREPPIVAKIPCIQLLILGLRHLALFPESSNGIKVRQIDVPPVPSPAERWPLLPRFNCPGVQYDKRADRSHFRRTAY